MPTRVQPTRRVRKKKTPPSLGVRNNIRALRFNRNEMTQEELANRVGLTRQTIIAIERGRYSPSLDAAFKIAKVLKVPFGEAFQFDDE